MLDFRRFIDIHLLGRHRLETVQMLPLGASLDDAIRLYGQPIKREASKETSDITECLFSVGPYHEAVVLEWKGTVQSITYWSEKANPIHDLRTMFERYKESSHWRVMEEGYWYQRADDVVRLWCSAAPAIGIAFIEFLKAKADYTKAYEFSQIETLRDPTWIADNTLYELQRRFVQERDSGLQRFATRSDRIAVAPDGRDVFIVRLHQARKVNEGFVEDGPLPESKLDCLSTAIIHWFHWDETGAGWSKIPLPTDARVESLRFDGETCRLEISRQEGARLTFHGSAKSIGRLSSLNFGPRPHTNAGLWQGLEQAAQSFAPG
jgi:hypothetical protein